MAWKRIAIALGVGYVLGAKAGKERYEELADVWDRISGSRAFDRLRDSAQRAYDWAGEAIGDAFEGSGDDEPEAEYEEGAEDEERDDGEEDAEDEERDDGEEADADEPEAEAPPRPRQQRPRRQRQSKGRRSARRPSWSTPTERVGAQAKRILDTARARGRVA